MSDRLSDYFEGLRERFGSGGEKATLEAMAGRLGMSLPTMGRLNNGLRSTEKSIRRMADQAEIPRTEFLLAAGFVPRDKDWDWDEEHFQTRRPQQTSETLDIVGVGRRIGHVLPITGTRVYTGLYCGDGEPEGTDAGEAFGEKLGITMAVQVVGDCMEPYYTDGDIVFLAPSDPPFLVRKQYVLRMDGVETCRILKGVEANGDEDLYTLASANDRHEEMKVSSTDAQIIFVVKGKFVAL